MAESRLLEVKHLVKHYPLKAGGFTFSSEKVHAVNDVSFSVHRQKTLGLVGESGCGKTTTGRMLLRVIEPDSGRLYFNQEENKIQTCERLYKEWQQVKNGPRARDAQRAYALCRDESDFLAYRGRRLVQERMKMQYIFQDPYQSLDPKMHVVEIITESLVEQNMIRRADRKNIAKRYLDIVGLPADSLYKFPHEFSGGQRQRINIARAIALQPKFIVCDEPVSSLDVSIQSQILNLLIEIQKELGISYLFIAHNLPVVFYISDDVSVMYAGKIVEHGTADELATRSLHPYTRLLMDASPEIGVPKDYLSLKDTGQVPNLINYPEGCTFYERCPLRQDRCAVSFPPLLETLPGHYCACFVVNKDLSSEEADT
jgi:oligopeptide/dipeptide ABC transporter ATP-binding protein